MIGKHLLCTASIFMVMCGGFLPGLDSVGARGTGVFHGFTTHIHQQITLDIREFAEAETCTQWFYHQLKRRPPIPQIKLLTFSVAQERPSQASCLSHYPTGLDGAREAFSKTQSALSLSLTFYQYALVSDADDDGEYSDAELEDIFESLGLVFQTGVYPAEYLTSLNHTFDAVRRSGQFDLLNNGMARLYEKGYRLSPADQVALNRVTQ